MKTLLNKYFIIFSLIYLLLFSSSLNAYQPAGITWDSFVKQSELIIWVKLIKWEILGTIGGKYTFKIQKTYKGPIIDSITIDVTNPMTHSIGPLGLAGEGFLFLKKENGKWVLSVDGRSWWPHLWEMKPDYNSIIIVTVPDSLVYNIPENLKKKTFNLVKILANGKHHQYEAKIFTLNDVDSFLLKHLK